MALVSVTRLRLRSGWLLPAFAWRSFRSMSQARGADGCLAATARNQPGLVFWTCSVWRDLAAMRAFMLSGAHKDAMPKLVTWCSEASVAHWETTADTLASWQEAEGHMRASGRTSRVRHPSPAQVRGEALPS